MYRLRPSFLLIKNTPCLSALGIQYLFMSFLLLGLVAGCLFLGLFGPSYSPDLQQQAQPKLHGRFLHITDMHPDMFYQPGTSIGTACHRGEGNSLVYGDPMAGCDSPYKLVEDTIGWIDENLKDKIDFIVWTGDNVRHDNDRVIPRTEEQIFSVNENISSLLTSVFKDINTPDPRAFSVPLIPSLGNNDVYPHNMFAVGPTLQTRLLYRTWSGYVPQEQAHVFEKTACFLREIVPGKLAVLLLNTLYLFKSNPLVDNCDGKKQPGYALFVWLGYTLKELRRRGMKVWITGHVPPVPKNYELTCYRKYILWTHEYRDVIIGGLYGHMNLDHFVPLDATAAYESLKKDTLMPGYNVLLRRFSYLESEDLALENQYVGSFDTSPAALSRELGALGASPGLNKLDYMNTVNSVFYDTLVSEQAENSGITKKKKKKKKKQLNDGTRYSIIHVAGSVIPTFNPAFRVWEYNTTGLDSGVSTEVFPSWTDFFQDLNLKLEELETQPDHDDVYMEIFSSAKRPDKSLPSFSGKDVPLGPAFEPQTFSPTHFTQYYVDLDAVNKGEKEFGYEVEYTSSDKPYPMKSLLVRDWVKLGRKLAKDAKKNKKGIWEKFLSRAFVSTGYEDWVKRQKERG